MREARRKSRQSHCTSKLKLVWLNLMNYEALNGHLPPANFRNSKGDEILSWRTAVGDYTLYEGYPQLDLGSSWTSPHNTKFHDSYASFFQCPCRRVESTESDFVAVTGRQTMWPDGQETSLNEASPNTILVVDWPNGGIHWMEPRDITVREFLAWFDSKQYARHGDHLLYVNVAGEIHELPKNTERREVLKLLSR